MMKRGIFMILILAASCSGFSNSIVLDVINKEEFIVKGILQTEFLKNHVQYRIEGKEPQFDSVTAVCYLECQYGKLHLFGGSPIGRTVDYMGREYTYNLHLNPDNRTYRITKISDGSTVLWEENKNEGKGY